MNHFPIEMTSKKNLIVVNLKILLQPHIDLDKKGVFQFRTIGINLLGKLALERFAKVVRMKYGVAECVTIGKGNRFSVTISEGNGAGNSGVAEPILWKRFFLFPCYVLSI